MIIFLRLFLVFSKIGILNFGGGYAMLSFIQNEVVTKNAWMTEQEFTDIVAISQMTPGPIGINAATYVGYTSVINDTMLQSSVSPAILNLLGILGSIVATFAVLWLPFTLMMIVSRLLIKHKNNSVMAITFSVLRPAIIGLIASAALSLMTLANFGNYEESPSQFIISLLICITVFYGTKVWKWNPISSILVCGALGIILYGCLGI